MNIKRHKVIEELKGKSKASLKIGGGEAAPKEISALVLDQLNSLEGKGFPSEQEFLSMVVSLVAESFAGEVPERVELKSFLEDLLETDPTLRADLLSNYKPSS